MATCEEEDEPPTDDEDDDELWLSDADGGLAKFGGRASCGPAAHLLSERGLSYPHAAISQNVRHVSLLVCVCVIAYADER